MTIHGKSTIGNERGIGLLEPMIAAVVLLIAFLGLARVYSGGRAQLMLEEDRRKATAVGQAHLDWIRRAFVYDDLAGLDEDTRTYDVDGRTFTVSTDVVTEAPEPQASTVEIVVAWNANVRGSQVPREVECTTILARGMGWGR